MIRAAIPEDIAAIDAFDRFAGDRSQEIAGGRMLVLEDLPDASVVGYVSWARKGFVGRDYIAFLCVETAHRRCGLATKLLRAAEAAIGPGRIFISTEADNSAMLALLQRENWMFAGSVEGANWNDIAEQFFFKDVEAASAT